MIPRPDDGYDSCPPILISKSAAQLSELMKSMILDDDDDEQSEIPIMEVNYSLAIKIAKFLERHANDPMRRIPKPIPSNNLGDFVDDWDVKFMDVDQFELFQIINAANYLDIKSLLSLAVAKFACMIKGRDPQDVQQMFQIGEVTEEEERTVRVENNWIFDLVEHERDDFVPPVPVDLAFVAPEAAAAAAAPAPFPNHHQEEEEEE